MTASIRPLALLACAALLAACSHGIISAPDDGGGRDAEPDSGPCAHVTCGFGQVCVDGTCRAGNACAAVVCSRAGEICEPATGRCLPGSNDGDRDGVTIAEGDCDDGNPRIYPGAPGRCDATDSNCDGALEDEDDVDSDGFADAACGGDDCDDSDDTVHPGALEVCNGTDDDCDGDTDEDIAVRACSTSCGEGTEQCQGARWVCDAPATCECSPAGSTEDAPCGNCGTQSRSCQADLSWGEWGECTGQGECTPTQSGSRNCSDCGSQSRTCGADCVWGGWSSCAGSRSCGTGQTCRSNGVCEVNCDLIAAASSHWFVCERGTRFCGGYFDDQGGCHAFCATVGLTCTACYGVGESCAETEFDYPHDCCGGDHHMSDWCDCGYR